MSKIAKVELYEGVGKESNKPFSSLKITIGTWTTLYFPASKFEMDYIKNYLQTPETNTDGTQKSFLED